MQRVKVGIIGLGRFGELHLSAFSGLPQAELVAVASRSEERAKEMAGKYGAKKWYSDYHKLVSNPDIEAVSVVTEEHRHTEPVLAALKAGKHVLVEKPVATTLEEADKMIEAAQKSDRILMVGHILRFDVKYAQAKEKIDAEELGEIVSIHGRRNIKRSHFEIYKRISPAMMTGVHDIDIMLWYIGEPVESVYALKRHAMGLETADTYWALLKFKKGAIGVLETIWLLPDSAPMDIDAKMEIIGTKGIIHIEAPSLPLSIWGKKTVEQPDVMWWPSLYGYVVGALKEELSYFLTCVQKNVKPTIIKPEEAREALRVALAIVESADKSEIVQL